MLQVGATAATALNPNSKPFAPKFGVTANNNNNYVLFPPTTSSNSMYSSNSTSSSIQPRPFAGPHSSNLVSGTHKSFLGPLALPGFTMASSSKAMATISGSRPTRTPMDYDGAVAQRDASVPDDYKMTGLARKVRNSRGAGGFGSVDSSLSLDDLGFSDDVFENVRDFDSPFSDQVASPLSQREVPEEYYVSGALPGHLSPPLQRFLHTDLLFFLFYCATGDELQLTAAGQLFDRGWRFSKVECAMSSGDDFFKSYFAFQTLKVWIARCPDSPPEYRSDQMEKGFYQYFDPADWRKKSSKLILKYTDLVDKPGSMGYSSVPSYGQGQAYNLPCRGHRHHSGPVARSVMTPAEYGQRMLESRKMAYASNWAAMNNNNYYPVGPKRSF